MLLHVTIKRVGTVELFAAVPPITDENFADRRNEISRFVAVTANGEILFRLNATSFFLDVGVIRMEGDVEKELEWRVGFVRAVFPQASHRLSRIGVEGFVAWRRPIRVEVTRVLANVRAESVARVALRRAVVPLAGE